MILTSWSDTHGFYSNVTGYASAAMWDTMSFSGTTSHLFGTLIITLISNSDSIEAMGISNGSGSTRRLVEFRAALFFPPAPPRLN